jgi:hypothetical protein
MRKSILKLTSVFSILLFVTFFSPYGFAHSFYPGAPVDNPFLTRYKETDHWTNNIKWNKITDASKVKGLLLPGNKVDSLVLHKTIKKISSQGGGVLYFAAGTYYFNFCVRLESGVVIRGDEPVEVKDATIAGFNPPTSFEFPRYIPVTTGCGPSHNSFKTIYGDTVGVVNAGLVNLNINRATIHFFPGGFNLVYTLLGEKYWHKNLHNNIILFGIRQNNAVIPSCEIPTQIQISKGHCWQRWPHPYIGNMNLFVSSNAVVANCRLNDSVTDNFEQPGYVDDFHGVFSGKQAMFSYIDHPGICLNSYNVISRGSMGKASGPWLPYGVMSDMEILPGFAELDSIYNPSYYSAGDKRIVDNYVFTKRRHGKLVSFGRNVVIKNNVTEDSGEELDYVDIRGVQSRYQSSPLNVLKYFEQKIFVYGTRKDTLPYLFKAPDDNDPSKRYPLIMFLHPDDLAGFDNQKQLALFMPGFFTEKNRKNYQAYILAPQENIVAGAWIDIQSKLLTKPAQLSKKLLDETIEKYNVDKDRIYIIGMAAGGIAAWQLAAQYPDVFAATVALDGVEFRLTDYMYQGLTKNNTATMAGIPRPYGFLTWFLNTRMSLIRLKKAGNDTRLTMVEANGRNEMMYLLAEDPGFYSWLFEKKIIRK